jgi:hypothetical protein
MIGNLFRINQESQVVKMNMPQKVRHYLGHFLWKEK